ncbi:hypothetical protein Lqui_2186 [Legionella quinlivanii]|uniref:Uncharacterized protein n=1 Tax=Legionella quinlivanii TaxID=45073 RepID=A0A0W0XU48_9GAMM|nr:hypothetical protein [Legionella quinlivanii]KTD47922.1 hypothetical protein Lqui_2186 [Legionella quinlivanii]SEG36691.1 hypothetical protein SAMN02746093_02671 [Legionella quinlivanii DSM 21216]STY10084.1 Uncharacterised protein [Legionella quinlivanii]
MSYEKIDPTIIPPRGENRHYPVGTVLGEFFYVGDKPGGVEPGFLGVKINPAFRQRISEVMPAVFDNSMPMNQLRETIKRLVAEPAHANYGQLLNFSQLIEKEGKTGNLNNPSQQKLDLWLIKQDYNDTPSGKVSPPKDRLEKTNAIKSLPDLVKTPATAIYQKVRLSDPEVENTNAVLEYFANSVAKAYGMQVQEQELAFGEYSSGKPKIMTACKWEPELRVFEGKLRGSVKKDLYQGHLVQFENKEPKTVNGRFLADDSVKDLGQSLPLVLAQGDRDVLGSQGQNKGRVGEHFFGFDFGHAYREDNPILDSLKDDFTFIQPADTNKKFKNISAFYDAPMSEKMMGMFYLYRMDPDAAGKVFSLQEQRKIEEMIRAYSAKNPDFAMRIARIQTIDKISDKVKTELSARSNQNVLFDQYVHEVEHAFERASTAHRKMFQIFKQKMLMTPEQVDVLDNLNKLSNPTSILSGDGQVVLSHLRIMPTKQPALNWKLGHKDGEYLFHCEPENRREEAYLAFTKYLSRLQDKSLAEMFKLSAEGIRVPAEHLPQFCKMLNETAIFTYKKQIDSKYHPKSTYMPDEATNYFAPSIRVSDDLSEHLHQSSDNLSHSRESNPEEFEEEIFEAQQYSSNNNNNNSDNLGGDIFSFSNSKSKSSSSSSSSSTVTHNVSHADWHHASPQPKHELNLFHPDLDHEVSSTFKQQMQNMIGLEQKAVEKLVGMEPKPRSLSDEEQEHEDESEGESEKANIHH